MVPLLFLTIFCYYLLIPSKLSALGGYSKLSYFSKDGVLLSLYRDIERINSFLSRAVGSFSALGVLLNYLLVGVLGVCGFRNAAFIY